MESMLSMGNLFAILFLLVMMQVAGTWLQVRAYRKAVKRLHKKGNLGIGALRRKLGPSNIVIIACSRDGVVTGGELMSDMTIFPDFVRYKGFKGKSFLSSRHTIRACPIAEGKPIKVLENRLNASQEVVA